MTTKTTDPLADISEEGVRKIMAAAKAEIDQGRIAFVNLDGDLGNEALRIIAPLVESGVGRFWDGTDERGAGGNCFFATTDVMVALIETNAALGFRLVTGLFAHRDQPSTTHCWLEYSRAGEAVAVNVSNMQSRPVYAMDRDRYLRINSCEQRVQSFLAEEVQRKLVAFRRRHPDDGTGVREYVRLFTKELLRRTLYRAALNKT